MAASKFSFQSFDLKHYAKTEAYARAVQALFDSATRDIMHMKQIGSFDPNKQFRWEDYPQAKAVMEQITLQLATRVVGTIERGSREEWLSSCKKNDAYLEHIMDTSKLTKKRLSQMQDRRLEALDAFQARKVNGLDLSQRVWKYVNQYKQNLEDGIDLGLGLGTSADVLSREVRKYLSDPDMYFRRFRVKVGTDENGQTVYGRKWKRMIKTPDGNVRWIDEAPQDYHPGAGKYRSSYKNAMRLTRSEINMSYRESDWERWQQLDFVVGFEIHRSNHRPEYKCKLCERLKGRYPKNFKFVGWHPHCRCYVTPIIMDDETFNNNEVEDLRAALRGTEAKHDQAKNAVVKMPDNFTEWANETAEKLANGEMHIKNMPYFVRDNFINGDIMQGVRPNVEQYDPLMSMSDAQSIVEKIIKSQTVPKGLSEEQQRAWVENEQRVSKELGIPQNEPMSFDEANEHRGNPHYSPRSNDGYTINCQSCVVANELRRRGWDVEALHNTKQADSIPYQLSYRTQWAWIDPKTGTMPKKIFITGRKLYDENMAEVSFKDRDKAKYQDDKFSIKLMSQQLEEATKDVGRYHLSWGWKGKKSGHIITVERLESGELRFYDPQIGEQKKWSDYKNRITTKSPLEIYRVDTLEPNPEIINRIVAKAGTTKPLTLSRLEIVAEDCYQIFLNRIRVVGRAKALEEIKQSFEYLHKNESFKWNDILDYFLKKELNGVTSDFSVRDFTKQIASLNRLKTNKERVDVLKQIIADKNFSKLEYHSGKRSIFAMGMKDYDKKLKENEMPTNLTLAKKFVQNGYNVYLMPNPHKLKSADFIIEKEGKLLYVEGKTLNGKNSLDHRLDSAAKQSRIAAIDVIGTNNASYIGKEIKAAFINNENLDEIILFKRGRIIRINRKKALGNGFEKDFRKQWNKQK